MSPTSYRTALSRVILKGYGWSRRIRTSEWQDQNLLPYHLAILQRKSAILACFSEKVKPPYLVSN